MRALLQRVSSARVTVGERTTGEISRGLLILLGVGKGDDEAKATKLAKKCAELRIFPDVDGKMNRSVCDVGGACLVVSQFTLYADVTQGRRPFFGGAEAPERANALCETFVTELRTKHGLVVASGEFGADMQVTLVNDGPVTIWLDTASM